VLAITAGEPAGIGPDLCLALLPPTEHDQVVITDPLVLAQRAESLGRTGSLPVWTGQPGPQAARYVLPVPVSAAVVAGQLDARNSAHVIAVLERAVAGCRSGEFQGLVTGPVHKGIINDAGIAFTGHTEFLATHSGSPDVVMMLAAPGLRVALATTHLPLAAVPATITRDRLTRVLRVLHADLRRKFQITSPCIRVCGLNPHAGEGGHLGREEIDTIAPVVEALRQEGMRLEGPVPADTAFLPGSLSTVDAILAMYHDQGLPVLKHYDFAHAINITLGLPFVRTSVDHGTALELAGTGRADATSFEAAIALASRLCHE